MRRNSRLLLVSICCVAIGAGASVIAGAGAATGASGHVARSASGRAAARGALRRFATHAVHGTVVVHTKHGFETVTFDRGRVDSVSGQQLTVTDATAKASYQQVTLTIPANARVRDNGRKATLADVKAGQRVLVLSTPQRTVVIARTPRGA